MSTTWLSPTNNSNTKAIREVQMSLGLHPDGQYSRGLCAAVTSFQSFNGLTSDGLVGPATLTALTGTVEKPKKKAATKTEAKKTPVNL